MTSIIAVIQVTALLTSAVLAWICLACSYKHSIPGSQSRRQVRRPSPKDARSQQRLPRPIPRPRQFQLEASFHESKKTEDTYE